MSFVVSPWASMVMRSSAPLGLRLLAAQSPINVVPVVEALEHVLGSGPRPSRWSQVSQSRCQTSRLICGGLEGEIEKRCEHARCQLNRDCIHPVKSDPVVRELIQYIRCVLANKGFKRYKFRGDTTPVTARRCWSCFGGSMEMKFSMY